jgi:hypothetical protein
MVDQLLYGHSVIWILLETFVEEVSRLLADIDVGGNGNLLLDYLYQLFLFAYFEGIFAHQHFVHHYAQGPDVDLLVVLVAFEDLGADVERSSAEGGPHFVA